MMKCQIKAAVVVLGVLFSFCMCLNAFALSKGYSLGPIKIKPSIDVSVEYNSNVELKQNDKEDDFIYRVTPGIDLSFGSDILKRQTRRLYFNTTYNAGYSHIPGKDHEITHTVGSVVRYNFSPLTSIGVHNTYRETPIDIYGGKPDDEYEYNTATASLKHQFSPRLTSEVFYTNSFYDSGTTETYDKYEDDIYGIGIDYRLSRKMNARLDLSQGERDFDKTEANVKNYDIQTANLGINYDLTKRTTMGVSVGYSERDYSIRETDDTEDIIYGASLTSRLTNFSTLRLDYSYSVLDTYNYPDPLGFITPFNRQIDVATGLDQQYKYIDVNRVGASLLYNLGERDTINLTGVYMKSEASAHLGLGDTIRRNNNLDEEAYLASLGYAHKFTRWLSLGTTVSYGNRKSNIRNDYDYIAIAFNTKLAF
jgi:hypothetical protein